MRFSCSSPTRRRFLSGSVATLLMLPLFPDGIRSSSVAEVTSPPAPTAATASSTALATPAVPESAAAASERLVINFFDAFPPFAFRNEAGEMTGILIDVISHLLNGQAGVPSLEFKGYPWQRAQELVRNGEADGFFTVPTDVRREYCLFSKETALTAPYGVFYAADHPQRHVFESARKLSDLENFSQADYIGNGFAERVFKDRKISWSPNLVAVLSRVAWQRVDLFIGNISVAQYLAREQGLADKLAFTIIDLGDAPTYHLGLRKTYPSASAILDIFDTRVRAARTDGSITGIIRNYTG